MDYFISILLGIVQGLTEFLPFSSSGILTILERLVSFKLPPLVFHAFVHFGSALAAAFVMRRELGELLSQGLRRSGRRKGKQGSQNYYRTLRNAAIPVILIGAVFSGAAASLSASPFFAGIGFLATGIVLLVTDRAAENSSPAKEISPRSGWLIGCAAGIALLPGISFTAIVICMCIFAGFQRKTAIRFLLLLMVPAYTGAFVMELITGILGGIFTVETAAYCTAGLLTGGVTSFLAVRPAAGILRKHSFLSFSRISFVIGAAAVLTGLITS